MAAVFDDLSDKELIKLINGGAIGVLPTDTVYGLVCQATDKQAVGRLYALKNLDGKPGTIIAANIEQLVELGFKRRYLKAVEQFWPGAVSVIVPSANITTSHLRLGLPDIAVRLPKDKKLTGLLAKTGPLLTTSANPAGKEPANTIEAAALYFGAKVDFYVDGGDLKSRLPSTIIRIIDDEIEVLRQGAVKINT